MKTQGEIEAAICKGMSHFEQDYMVFDHVGLLVDGPPGAAGLPFI